MVACVELKAEALLFDLDGTLVDSTASIVHTWLQWASEFGVDPAALADGHGRTSAQIVADVVRAEDAEVALARIVELETADAANVRAMPGAVELLAALPPERWAIVTSGNTVLATARMRAAGIPVAPIVTADDVTHGKPHPEPYLLGAARLGFAPELCVVVEDAPSGIASARAAGMAVVGIASTYPADRLAADVVVGAPSGLRISGAGPFVVSEVSS